MTPRKHSSTASHSPPLETIHPTHPTHLTTPTSPSSTTATLETAMPTTPTIPNSTTPATDAVAGSAHYARYLPQAMALPESEVKSFRPDVSLATINAARGVEMVLGHASELAVALPRLDVGAVRTLGDLGSALAFAAAQVERFAPTPTNLKAQLVEARSVRALLLAGADMLVLTGVFPAGNVAKIRKGRGPIDTAGDCVALAALFTKYGAAATAKVAVTAADIQRADEVGSRLLRLLRPGRAKKPVDKDLIAATDARDRLWTLFERTWQDNVWRAGAWLFGRDVEQYVPPLHSRVGGRRAAAHGTVPPAPPPTPAAHAS